MPKRLLSIAIAVGLLASFAGGPRAAADEEVARFLLEQGKKAMSKRRFDEAVVKLERALEEDPELLESAYVLGQVFEKRKEPGRALGAYRTFRDGCRAQGDALDKKLARLLPRAEKRIAVLGKGERELEKLQKAFAERILAFAHRQREEDPDIAVDALRRLVAVVPDHAAAKRLLRELGADDVPPGGPEPADPGSTVIPGIDAWDDLLDRRAIPPGTNIQYGRGLLTIDQPGGTIFWTDPYVRAPETFVYEMEFRFLEEHAIGYLLGLAFALDEEVARSGGNELVMAFAQKSQLVLVQASGGQNIDIGESAIPAKPLGTWRRLTVAVEGRKARVLLDGKQLVNSTVPGRRVLSGPIGLFHQRSKVEIRVLRLGTKE